MRWTEDDLMRFTEKGLEKVDTSKRGAKRKGPTPETALKRAIKQYLSINGWYVFPILQGLGAHRGIADLCAVKKGLTVWLEVKRPGGRQSDYQVDFQDNVERHGGTYKIIKSVDELIEWINHLNGVENTPNSPVERKQGKGKEKLSWD